MSLFERSIILKELISVVMINHLIGVVGLQDTVWDHWHVLKQSKISPLSFVLPAIHIISQN